MLDWWGFGPYGRAGLVLGVVGTGFSLLGVVMWMSAAAKLDFNGWYHYRHRDPLLPPVYQRAYRQLDGADTVMGLGFLLALAGLVLALLNANQSTAPRSTALPIIVSGSALAAAFFAFLVCSPR
jgi:uncharacterized iron-regulated membrane protein